MSNILHRVAAEVLNKPIMAKADYLEFMLAGVGERLGLDKTVVDGVSFEIGEPEMDSSPSTVTIPIIGSLTHRGGFMDALSGMRSYQAISSEIDEAADDPSIETIFMEIDSPGGLVAGVFDLADKIQAVSERPDKRVIAIVNGTASSAAYLLASAANRIYMTQSSEVGSIGVVMAHIDKSKKLKKEGIKPTFIYAGKFKVDGNSAEHLSDETKARVQSKVDEAYDKLVSAVASNRSMSEVSVRATEALTFTPEKAIELGLADGVRTIETVMEEALSLSANQGNPMSKELLFSQAQMDEALASAKSSATVDASAEAFKKGAKAEGERISAIMASEHYAGREALAAKLIEKGMSATDAVDLMAAVPVASVAPAQAPEAGAAQKAALAALAAENPNVKPSQATPAGELASSDEKTAARLEELKAAGKSARAHQLAKGM